LEHHLDYRGCHVLAVLMLLSRFLNDLFNDVALNGRSRIRVLQDRSGNGLAFFIEPFRDPRLGLVEIRHRESSYLAWDKD